MNLYSWDLNLIDLGLGTWDLELDLGLGTWDLGLGTWDLGLGTWDLGLIEFTRISTSLSRFF